MLDAINSHPVAGPFTIIIVDKMPIWGTPEWGDYDPSENYFFIREGCLSFDWYRYAFVHDIGHAYHFSFTKWLICPPDFFATIREKERPPTEYAKQNYFEDFAETFTLYFLKPDYLKEKCPLRYGEIERILQSTN